MKVKICVSENNLREGVRADCEFCPIGLAMQEATGGKNIVAGQRFLFFDRNGHTFRAKTPKVAREFMGAFDAGCLGMPFNFIATFKKQ